MLVIIRQLLYGIWIIQINIKTIFKRILKYTLGASYKDCTDSTSCKSDIFKWTGSEFFFPGTVQVSSEFESLVTGMTREPQGCWLGVSGARLSSARGSAALGTAGGRHNLCTSTPWAMAEPSEGRAGCPHRTQRSVGYALRNQSSLQFWNAYLSVKERFFISVEIKHLNILNLCLNCLLHNTVF